MTGLTAVKPLRFWWMYALCVIYVALNSYCISKEFYWLNIIPPVLLVAVAAVLALDKLILFCVFLTPLSINLADSDINLGLSLPVEPILAGILFLFILRVIKDQTFDKKFLRHPVTIAIILNIVWIFITSVTSELPMVSFKFLASRLWFVVPFYFIGSVMFRDFKNVRRFLWLYILPLTIVIGYTVYWHAQYRFDEDSAHWVMSPFYNDHTAYGAALAMFYPALISFAFSKYYSNNIRVIALILLGIFTIALILSYTRAAWVSLAAAFVLYLIFLFRIHYRYVLLTFAIVIGFIAYSWTDIMLKLEQNRQDTSNDIEQHLQSISNISTDASNLERLNRWSCAFRMFYERPIVGWGPGTYSFEYAPFQLSSEKTIISTNAGNLGNAHSEYIGPLCESGVLGAFTFLLIFGTVMWTGWRLYYKLPKGVHRAILLSVLLGLVTYFIHGAMNNFLDTDKASIPFWGFIAMLVAADIYYPTVKDSEEGK
ncbi:MAG TPA: O-antigen ligase family protein [Bacteroidia bacterium]|jgi:O-antigen ligase|nr:O-antigen ligase family protein [Bacteroidia bacterium]